MGFVLFVFLKDADRSSLCEPAPHSLLLQQDCKVPMELKLQPLIGNLEASPHHFVVVSDKHSRIKEHYMYYFAVGEVVEQNSQKGKGDWRYYFLHYEKLAPP